LVVRSHYLFSIGIRADTLVFGFIS
jgi:hypothetical protein